MEQPDDRPARADRHLAPYDDEPYPDDARQDRAHPDGADGDDPYPQDPADQPDAAPPATPPWSDRLRAAGGALQDRFRERAAEQRYSFVPATEVVAIDARQHPLTLLLPVVRTFAGLALLLVGPLLLPLLWFALVTAVWARVRFPGGLRRSAIIGAGAAGALVVLHLLDGRRWDALLLLLLLGWLAEDVADWYSDRLVVTDKRIYRRHGVLTRHSPSISLMAIAYIDASVPPLGQLLHYGTLKLDSVAQRDAPLSRFDLIPDVVPVSHEILRLRAAAMPKGPPPAF